MAEVQASFAGHVARAHIDGRHLYVEFDGLVEGLGKTYDYGLLDLTLVPRERLKGLQPGASVSGKVLLNGSNLAVVTEVD